MEGRPFVILVLILVITPSARSQLGDGRRGGGRKPGGGKNKRESPKQQGRQGDGGGGGSAPILGGLAPPPPPPQTERQQQQRPKKSQGRWKSPKENQNGKTFNGEGQTSLPNPPEETQHPVIQIFGGLIDGPSGDGGRNSNNNGGGLVFPPAIPPRQLPQDFQGEGGNPAIFPLPNQQGGRSHQGGNSPFPSFPNLNNNGGQPRAANQGENGHQNQDQNLDFGNPAIWNALGEGQENENPDWQNDDHFPVNQLDDGSLLSNRDYTPEKIAKITKARQSIEKGNVTEVESTLKESEDVEVLADVLRFPAKDRGKVLKKTKERERDGDVVVMKGIARAVMYNGMVRKYADVMVKAVTDGIQYRSDINALEESITNVLRDRALMRRIAFANPTSQFLPGNQGRRRNVLCDACSPADSWVCAHCWPSDICGKFWWCPNPDSYQQSNDVTG